VPTKRYKPEQIVTLLRQIEVKIATGKLEAFRIAGIVQAIENSKSLTTPATTVN
jgi:hypothetical protein